MPPRAKAIAAEGRRLRVSLYDRASSGLMALLIAVGSVVALLLVVWLSSKLLAPPSMAVPVKIVDVYRQDGEDGGNGRPSGGTQVDEPSREPFVGKDPKTRDVQESLSGVDSALVAKAVALDEDPDLVVPLRRGSYGTGGGRFGGKGPGDGLDIGDRPPGHARHWEITFPKGNTLDAYARQLDFFGIELGVVIPGDKVVYAFHLSKPKPDTRLLAEASSHENRFYLSWRDGDLRKADRELLVRAGVQIEDEVVLQFLPDAVEARLAAMEREFRGAEPKRIGKTRFGVRPVGDKFEFYVIEQTRKR
jgi:hypothetical protein